MDNSLKDIRRFIIKQIIKSSWSSEGRSDFYSNGVVSIKKDFDKSIWTFSLQNGNFYSFKDIGINKYILYFLLFFVKHSDRKRKELLKSENIRNEWVGFLKRNKDIDRDNKINKIIND